MSQLFAVEQSAKTSDDYLTPRWVFDTLGLTFDLDVASPPWETHVPALRKFTKADDGLTQPWVGRVWMNPPYSKPKAWADRFVEHGHGIALLPFSQSQWTIDIWNTDAVLMLPPKWFDFEGTRPGFSSTAGGRQKWSMRRPVFFAAFGDECVEAIGRLGRVR